MKYNIKDYLIIILFIIIIYLLFFNTEKFKNNDSKLNESFLDQSLDQSYKDEIKNQCQKIKTNISYILKATYDAVANNDDFRFIKENIKINNMQVNNNMNVQQKMHLNKNIRVTHKYNIDNDTKIVTPLTELNVFPDYMIVAYNSIELNEDGKTPKTSYNLPPGWVKCDGKTYYTYFDIVKNKTIAVNESYDIYNNEYDAHGSHSGTVIDYLYENDGDPNIEIIYKVKDIRKIITPDLRGRFIYGTDIKKTIDSYVFKKDPHSTNNIINLDSGETEYMQQAKGGHEYIKLNVDQISHNHLTHISISIASNALVPIASKPYMNPFDSYAKIYKSPNFIGMTAVDIPTDMNNDNAYVITTSDFYGDHKDDSRYYYHERNINNTSEATPPSSYYSRNINTKIINFNDMNNDHDIPHQNMPPFYTLIYIMKIATESILNETLETYKNM